MKRPIVLYRLHRHPDEAASESEDWDEWFENKQAALDRRQALIDADPMLEEGCRFNCDYGIDRVEFLSGPGKSVCLRALRREFFRVDVVVPPYERPRDAEKATDD